MVSGRADKAFSILPVFKHGKYVVGVTHIDDGFELQQLPQLEYVDLSGTQVSLESVRRLYETMPNLRRTKYVELQVAPGKKGLQVPTS